MRAPDWQDFHHATGLVDAAICSAFNCRSLRSALQNAESSQRGFLVGGNEIYLAPYGNAKTQARVQFERLKASLFRSSQIDRMIKRLTDLIAEKVDEMDRAIALKGDLHDADALALFRSNRGKALMDEANVFLSSIIRISDERLTTGITEQRRNATWLRWVSVIGGLIIIIIIIIIVGGVTITIFRYAREIAETRDEVQVLNASLEQRVRSRTADLIVARDNAEVLLAEVNHRVANSLSMVSALVRLQSKGVKDQVAKDALKETQGRIDAISAVHKSPYSSGDARFVDLDQYLSGLLTNVETSMRNEGHGASLRYDLEPLKLKPDLSVNLGVIMNEWVINAFKYAYPDRAGEVRVHLKRLPEGRAELIVEDDGVGRGVEGVPKGSGLGTRIVNAMARTIGAEVEYIARHPGTGARLAFPSPAEIA
ncbi:sensor histidine kinase [Bradyrhizobium lablabi]|uniref:sensor histidine kinase n=1 Tax=Bradyrhizobium lablabi TaxID=722472 RepID=UPI00090BE26B|nr:CHASE3 domain-containing protein [Bradyrhizobium lablabi]SHK60394.1 Two-component sensor histidine kinase, contains HisKA and HATPase domains [Bradyrhizobium lablabi]